MLNNEHFSSSDNTVYHLSLNKMSRMKKKQTLLQGECRGCFIISRQCVVVDYVLIPFEHGLWLSDKFFFVRQSCLVV